MRDSFLSHAMQRHGDAVYRLALCRLQNTQDAEDVFQDTFLKLLQEKQAERWEDDHLKAWLIRVAINRCTDLGRRRKFLGFLTLEDIPELASPDHSEKTELWEAVNHLPDRQRTIFHLFYAEGYKTEEIADLLGIGASAVRVNLNRARNTLRKELTACAQIL